jgi:hypothetical protein
MQSMLPTLHFYFSINVIFTVLFRMKEKSQLSSLFLRGKPVLLLIFSSLRYVLLSICLVFSPYMAGKTAEGCKHLCWPF